MKNYIKYITGLAWILLLVINFSFNLYADVCGCADDITDAEELRKSRTAQEKIWSMIDEYADPKEFLTDPWTYSGPAIYIVPPLTDEQLSILKKEAERVTANCNTQYDKIEAIFSYVHDRIVYNNAGYYNPYDIWYYKQGQCGEYATLTRTMLVSIGIPCMYLTGCNHGYNAAYDSDSDRWIFLDSTNNLIDLNIEQRCKKPMWFVYEIEGLCIDGVYYSIYTGVEEGKKWYDMEWELHTTGVKNKNSKSYKIKNEICDIPVTKIGGATFAECKNVSSISIPYGVETLGNSVFYNCSSLKEVLIPDSVKILGDSVFGCSGLEIMDLSDTNIVNMGYYTFDGCDLLRKVVLPEGLKEIGDGSFSKCINLKEVDLSKTNITTIASQFFMSDDLEIVKFPDTLTTIGDNLFWGGAKSMTSIDLSNTKVTSIGGSSFSGSGIISIKLPSTLKTIGSRAFYSCTNLKQIDFSRTKLTSIGERAFEDCISLTTIKLPTSLNTLGKGMCWYCTKLKEINLQNTKVTDIPDYAFAGCTNATIIRLPDSIKFIGKCSFSTDAVGNIYTLVCSKFSEDELNDMGYIKEGKSPWYPSFSRRSLYTTSEIYTVTYEANGGKLTGIKKDYAGKGIKIVTLSTAQRSGYVFKGWYTDKKGGNKITIGSKISKNTTLYAQWIKKPAKVKGIKKASTSSNRIKLMWKKIAGVKGYDIYRKTSKNGKYKLIASTSKPSYTDKKLKQVKGCYYMIRAYKKINGNKIRGDKSEIYVSLSKNK